MHLSDTLVIGPLPLRARTVRLPVGTALAIAAALLVAAAVAVGAPRLLATVLTPLETRLAVVFPALAPAFEFLQNDAVLAHHDITGKAVHIEGVMQR